MTGTRNASHAPDSLRDRLRAKSVKTVDTDFLRYKVRPLGPREAVSLGVGVGMVQAASVLGKGSGAAPPPLPVAGEEKFKAFADRLVRICCFTVIEAAEPNTDDFYEIRIVRTHEEEDIEGDPPRLFIGGIPPEDLRAISEAATADYKGAAKAAGMFRG